MEEFLALIVRKLPSDGIMKEENREHPERFCWWCFKKGVQDGIENELRKKGYLGGDDK